MVEYDVLEERENQLMNRKEIKISIPHSGAPTPSRAMIQNIVSEKEGVDARHIIVDKILSGVGRAKCKAFVDIYTEPVTEDLTANAEPEETPEEDSEEETVSEESEESEETQEEQNEDSEEAEEENNDQEEESE